MQKLIQGVCQFREQIFRPLQALFVQLSKGQHPETLFITCADSRIDPNLLTQSQPGDLFILRNAGNIVPPHGAPGGGEAATIEFAVSALGVKDIIICGHSDCGAMKALLQPQTVSSPSALSSWLSHAETTRRIVRDNYGHLDGDCLLTATIQKNVLVQLENLRTLPAVASRLVRGDLHLHGWVYQIEAGEGHSSPIPTTQGRGVRGLNSGGARVSRGFSPLAPGQAGGAKTVWASKRVVTLNFFTRSNLRRNAVGMSEKCPVRSSLTTLGTVNSSRLLLTRFRKVRPLFGVVPSPHSDPLVGSAKEETGMHSSDRRGFWREAFALQGSITPHVLPNVLVFGLIAAAICQVAWLSKWLYQVSIGLEVAPFELAGAALGLLLIMRTSAGYDRWWEARKLWGGIVNQSRNLVINALSYGPPNPAWREQLVRWAAAYPHVARCSLRGEPPSPRVAALVGPQEAAQIAASGHMPSFVALRLAHLLQEACHTFHWDRFAFLQVDRERATLLDHVGACERILKTPLPLVFAIKIRRFIALFLLVLPFALLHRMDSDWLVPLVTMLVAYPLLALDQIGVELQNPFARANLGHLPLNDISAAIEQNLMGLLKAKPTEESGAPKEPSLGQTGKTLHKLNEIDGNPLGRSANDVGA
jgi:predicted membrane chloride channel (bestrophin family)/carbonic anhydrase